MKYGHFDDINREYVIDTPFTPLPWINYLGENDFFGIISNTCGGYSFYKDAKLMRITRYRYNNVPRDLGGRYYYIKDGDNIWNPGYMPTQTKLDSYQCRHGLNYSIFKSSKNSVSAELTCFVPLNTDAEVHKLVITNNSSFQKRLNVYGTAEFCLYNAVDDANNFQRNYNIGEVIISNDTIYHITEYRERRNHFSFFHVNKPVDGFDSDLDTFVGPLGSWQMPKAIEKGTSYNSVASGWSPIAALRNDIDLQPGQKVTLIYTLGLAQNKDEDKYTSDGKVNLAPAAQIISSLDTEKKVDLKFNQLRKRWDTLLEKFSVKTSDEKFNRQVNIWNQYQCMTTFQMSRSASYYESGIGRGMGFRDSCQDILGFVHLIPDKSRQRILDLASIQAEDGSTYHQYQPLSKKGNADIGGGFNDDPLWLVACTSAYIKETGDFSILDEKCPFDGKFPDKTLFDHIKASVYFTINNKGPHGLPLIGRADWNDCLNLNCFSKTPGEAFQTISNYESHKAESVFIAGMFVKYGQEFSSICFHLHKDQTADDVLKEVRKTEKAVIDFGWDGDWFIRAYDAFGHKVGSKECQEGKIFIEPQGFCTLAGIGKKEGLGQRSMASVKKYLLDDYGVEILAPCYKSYHVELGEISSYPPGYKENGSVFTHTNPWVIIAETAIGNNEEAYDIIKRIAPPYLESRSEIRRAEPYVFCQTIAGRESPRYGEGKNSFLTGTASWSFVALSQAVLGIKPTLDGLYIDPHIPKEFKDIRIVRKFRGSTYNIHIINSGSYSLKADGVLIDGKLIKPVSDKVVEVEVSV